MSRRIEIQGVRAPFDVCWDKLGIPHIYAGCFEDAYRGMGYAAGYARLWQIHLSTLYAQGCAASVLGKRFLVQDAVHRAFDVPASRLGLPDSPGDWVVDAYLDGLNSYVDSLDEIPPEFRHAGCEPRHYTFEDVASRYRFTSWYQQRTWVEKVFLGRLMATHGERWWLGNVRRFSTEDAAMIEELRQPLSNLDPKMANLLYPDLPVSQSGSNNWAVQGHLSASGMPMLATDPHQPHSLPNTFFYAHLSCPGWDAFGVSFPGAPYFMMGYNRNLAWGLTTGCVDNYDVYVEHIEQTQYRAHDGLRPLITRQECFEVKDQDDVVINLTATHHGPLLETLLAELALADAPVGRYQTSVRWELAHHATSAGALARLPLATDAQEFGETLFENDVAPLVNNIICVDRDDDLRRFIVGVLPKRSGYTGTVPLAGWRVDCEFESSRAEELLVEHNPSTGYAVTANDDTLGEGHAYPIHNFPASNARADRIRELLDQPKDKLNGDDFKRMQLDLLDKEAQIRVPEFLTWIDADDPDVHLAREILQQWDCVANVDSPGACVYYALLDKQWHIEFMTEILDDPLIRWLPSAAIALNRWRISHFMARESPWQPHREKMREILNRLTKETIVALRRRLGDDPKSWRFGNLHQIHFWHTLRKYEPWQALLAGPSEIGGSATTLRMAMHMGNESEKADPDSLSMRVYHGPAFRLIVDLAHPERCDFVIAGGNSARAESPHTQDHYDRWLNGGYFEVCLDRDRLEVESVWQVV